MNGIDSDIPKSISQRLSSISDTLETHLGQPDVDVDLYVLASKFNLAERAEQRHRIYLDLRYWINCRDARLGIPKRRIHTEIWTKLKKLADANRICCPLSWPVFSEIIKQNPESRRATATIVDRLSDGLAVADGRARAVLELSSFAWKYIFRHRLGPGGPPFLHAWLPLTYFMGVGHPHSQAFDHSTNQALQKSFFDFFSQISFAEMMDMLDEMPVREFVTKNDVDFENDQIARLRSAFKSISEVYSVELSGVSDLLAADLEDFAGDLIRQGYWYDLDGGPRNAANLALNIVSLAVAALKCRRVHPSVLPSLHIPAMLHAALRHTGRRLQVNDYADFRHAEAGLAYCHAFFTDRKTQTLIQRPEVKLDSTFDCTVLSDDEAVLDYLLKLG